MMESAKALINAQISNDNEMELTEATEIFGILQSSRYKQEFDDLIRSAILYSRIRVDWYVSVQKELDVDDNERTFAHNHFISSCAAMSEKMKASGENVEWRFRIGRDRKAIGDFACLLHAVMGIKAR